MKRISIAVFLSLLVSACTYGYDHPTANYNQYMKDRYVCLMQASGVSQSSAIASFNETGGYFSSSTRPSCGMMVSCMALKGYVASQGGGRLKPPPSGGVKCN